MKNFKLKVLAGVLASTTLFGAFAPVLATPVTGDTTPPLSQQQAEYLAIEEKITALHLELDVLLDEITDLVVKIEETDGRIAEAEARVQAKEVEIRETAERLDQKIEEYGQRLRAMYMQGSGGILSAFLGADSLADLIARADAIIQMAKIDRQLLSEIETMKAELDNQKAELQAEVDTLQALNAANKGDLLLLEEKKAETETTNAAMETEMAKIAKDLVASEKDLMSHGKMVINDRASTDEQISAAITELRNIRSQIITEAADEEVVELIEKGKRILSERKLARERNAAQAPKAPSAPAAPSYSSSAVLNEAYKYIGVPYVWGGSTPNGFDCSGFTQYVFGKVGVSLPRVSREQAKTGTYVPISQAQPGDLLYFGNSSVSHVAIYVGNNMMIHAPAPGKAIKVQDMTWHLKHYRILGARRF